MGVFHAAIVLGAHDGMAICPNPDNLNAKLFGWNAYTATCLFLTIFVGGPIRITAVSTLGDDFLGALTPPDYLITTGVYRYIQHPGYTGQIIILATNLAMVFRWDGVLACFVPGRFLKDIQGYGVITCCLIILAMVQGLPRHVKIEEALLKNAFGKKWERWHASTKRFIPGVF
jgi:protein-S-isoprenylcysteine O-methyltransferase Ste14